LEYNHRVFYIAIAGERGNDPVIALKGGALRKRATIPCYRRSAQGACRERILILNATIASGQAFG